MKFFLRLTVLCAALGATVVVLVLGQSASDYPITFTTCNAGSNCGGAGSGCVAKQLTAQQPCSTSSTTATWFTCPTDPKACFRAQYFSDPACTVKTQDLHGVCNVCQQGFVASSSGLTGSSTAMYACGNPTGNGGVMTISQRCTSNTCGSGTCANVTVVPALGQCVFDGVGYVAVSELYQCLVAVQQTTVPGGSCPAPVADTSVTLVQGACYLDTRSNSMMSVTCNEYVSAPPGTWAPTFTTTAAPPTPVPTTTTAAPTITATPKPPGPPGPTATGVPVPPPATIPPSASIVTRQVCSDQRYCNPSTCVPVLNGTGPGGATLSAECVGEGLGNYVQFQCPANGNGATQCATVAHYTDTACSTVSTQDTVVCNQCLSAGGNTWFYVDCTATAGSGINVKTCSEPGCRACSKGVQMPTGTCVNQEADTGSVGFAVERGPFACNAILGEFYHYDASCKTNRYASVLIPDGYCRFGNVVTCPSTVPPPSDLPAPSTLSPTISGDRLMLSVSDCADVHCSQSCTAPQPAPTGICDIVNFDGELPAADPTAPLYTELYACLPEQGQGWVVSMFTNSSCTQVHDQLVLACGKCQRSFVTGDYFYLTCGPTLQIYQGCDSSCQQCGANRLLTPGQCTADFAGNYLMPQRHTPYGTLIQHTVYSNERCLGTPIVDYTTVSGECESRKRIVCANAPIPTVPQSSVPAVFEGTFDYPPTEAAFTSAMRAFFFSNNVSVVFTSDVTSRRCGLDMCYMVNFKFTGPAATDLAQQVYILRDSHPITLDRWFNLTTLAAASADGSTGKKGSTAEVVTVAVVCSAIAAVLLMLALCFARRRNRTLTKEELVEGEDYVSMSETSSVSSAVH